MHLGWFGHPTSPETHTFGPLHKIVRAFGTNEVTCTDKPEFSLINIKRLNVRRKRLPPDEVSVYIEPTCLIYGIYNAQEILHTRNIVSTSYPISMIYVFVPAIV